VSPLRARMVDRYGPRRVLIGASLAFAVLSLITPYSPNLPTLLAMQLNAFEALVKSINDFWLTKARLPQSR